MQLGPPLDTAALAKQRQMHEAVLESTEYFEHLQVGSGGQATVYVAELRQKSSLAEAAAFLAVAVGSTTASAIQFLQEELHRHVYKRFKSHAELDELQEAPVLPAALLQGSDSAAAKGE
jgi:hypothetical protein